MISDKQTANNVHEPVVSVIMSVYNGEKTLGGAIESILSQTFQDFELIIINDGSTDQTSRIIGRYSDRRIKSLEHNNIGLTRSLNKAIEYSKGVYIARIDADETALPDRLEKQLRFMEDHPDTGVVGSFCVNINQMQNNIEQISMPVTNDEIRKALICRNPFIHGSVMIRREVFSVSGYYDESFIYMQDYELWGRIAKDYRLYNIPEYLLKRKITNQSLSSNPSIMTERARLGIKAQLRVIKYMSAGLYSYFYIWKRVIRFILCYTGLVKYPLRSKIDLLRALKRT